MQTFFAGNYSEEIGETLMFYSNGDEIGEIINDNIYSSDNLFVHYSLLRDQFETLELLSRYQSLKESSLYFDGNDTNYKYGFIKNINGTTGLPIDADRYLVDNLHPIFYFSETLAPAEYTSIKLGEENKNALDFTVDAFNLLNSSEFWDGTNMGFYTKNSSSSNSKYAFDNLYATLAMLEISKLDIEDLDEGIKARALELANITIHKLLENLWDNEGFRYFADSDWGSGGAGSSSKYLDVNALGIMALIKYWKQTSSLKNSTYFQNATLLYDKLGEKLWNSTYKAYEFSGTLNWDSSSQEIDLRANTYMMQACLDLFEVTGNFEYYNRALTLYDTFQNSFYDNNVNAYNSSIGSVTDNNKNLGDNAHVALAYLDASSIYEKTQIKSSYNVSEETPDFILNQDTLELNSNYTLDLSDSTLYNITGADISYIIRYPNDTIYEVQDHEIKENKTEGHLPEITKITCTNDTNGDLNGTYFNLTTPSQKYYVWFNLSSTEDPGSDFTDRKGIQVTDVSVNESKEEIASSLKETLKEYEDFDLSLDSENLTVEYLEPGITEDAADGSPPSATNFTFTIMQEGTNKTVIDHTLRLPIDEDLLLSNDFSEHIEEGKSYTISMHANKSFFKIAFNQVSFNIISGLANKSIVGIDEIENFYQGQTINISLPIDSSRANNLTLNATLTGTGITNESQEIKIIAGEETSVEFNISADFDAFIGFHELTFQFKHNDYLYLEVTKYIEIKLALQFSNLVYQKDSVAGQSLEVGFNLKNLLRNNTQSFNLTYSGEYIENKRRALTLNEKELSYISDKITAVDSINESSMHFNISISKRDSVIFSKKIEVNVVRGIEIINVRHPKRCGQGQGFLFTISLKNNYEDKKSLRLFINGEETEGSGTELTKGLNTLEKEIFPTINPYEFGNKNYKIEIKDADGTLLYKTYIEVEITLTTTNLVLFYLIPLIAPIGILLYYKNKDIKTQLLRR
ncbi:MAG: hypothetical protein ACOC4M_02870 [Promethearchaeia archaeon]